MSNVTYESNVKAIVEAGYNKAVEMYNRLEGNSEWPRLRRLRELLALIKPRGNVLDIGCGSGDPADIEIAKLHKVTGVDISEKQISLARKNVPAGTYIHGDCAAKRFANGTFQAVVSFYTIEHFPRSEHLALFKQIHEWLAPNGYFLFSMEANDYNDKKGEWLGVPMFMSCFDPKKTKQLVVEAGFQIIKAEIENQIEQEHEVPYLWVLAQST